MPVIDAISLSVKLVLDLARVRVRRAGQELRSRDGWQLCLLHKLKTAKARDCSFIPTCRLLALICLLKHQYYRENWQLNLHLSAISHLFSINIPFLSDPALNLYNKNMNCTVSVNGCRRQDLRKNRDGDQVVKFLDVFEGKSWIN